MQIIDVTDAAGQVIAPQWLAAARPVHLELRPDLPADYPAKMQRVFAGGGRMCVAVAGQKVLGVGIYRCFENTAEGPKLYVDDLVTAPASRSTGVGHALLAHLEQKARAAGCAWIDLDSGTHRQQAHKFYFREGMVITSFHFKKRLG